MNQPVSQRTPVDQENRNAAVSDFSGNLLVEASAGAGKTSVLVRRLLELVLSGQARLTETVAITFTEKAAGELKQRLRQDLEDALRPLGSPEAQDEERLRRATTALEDLEAASVGTIHSFCASLLRERPVEAGVDPEFEVLAPLQTTLLEEEVWAEWLERVMGEEQQHPYLLAAALLGIDVGGALHAVGAALNTNRDLLDLAPAPEPLPEAHEAAAQVVEACNELAQHVVEHCTTASDRLAATASRLNEEAADLTCASGVEQAAALVELQIPKADRLGNQKNWSSKEALAEARERIRRAAEIRERFAAEWGRAVAACFVALARTYVEALTARKQAARVLDFQDLLLRARDLLRDSRSARTYFKTRFKYLLIDEFQDTDPLQTEIIFYLAEADDSFAREWNNVRLTPGKLFVVGDPKQSIYRFRRADIELFQQVSRLLQDQGRRLELSQNFRSAPGIITPANKLFSTLIQRPEDGDYQPDYVPLAAWHEGTPGGAVVLFPPDAEEGGSANAAAGRAAEALCLAKFIRAAVGSDEFLVRDRGAQETRALRYRDVALLFRTTTGLDVYEDALRDLEIPYQIAGGKRFYARQEVKSLVAVLRALDNPADEVALYAALTSPFFGLSDEELFLFRQTVGPLLYPPPPTASDAVSEALALLNRLHEKRNTQSVAATLLELFDNTKALELFALKPTGEQRVANLLKIVDSARELRYAGRMTFRRFVVWLRDLEQDQRAEAESPTIEADDDFVSLLTIHKAKGLEFPLVILANPAGTSGPDRTCVLVDRAHHCLEAKLGASALSLQTAGFVQAHEREQQRARAEEIRLLYVAMTRAMNWFVVPAGWNRGGLAKAGGLMQFLRERLPRGDQVAPGEWVDGWLCYDIGRLGPDPEERPVFRLALDPDASLTPEAEGVIQQREAWCENREAVLRRAAATPTPIRPSGLVDEQRLAELRQTAEPGGGTAFGDLVHRLLAALDEAEDLRKLAQRYGRLDSLCPEVVEEACNLVENARESDLLRRARCAARRWREIPFSLRSDAGIVEGTIDLVFEEEGDLILVDFKTDQIGADDAAAAAQLYAPQLRQYRWALEQLSGRTVRETLVFFLRPQVTIPVPR